MAEGAQFQDPSTGPLESRLEFETLISDTSAALFAIRPEETTRAVERTLGQVRRFFKADICGLLRVVRGRDVVHVRAASYGEGIVPVPPSLNLAAAYPWTWRRLVVDRSPVRFVSVREVPVAASIDLSSWRELGVRSVLALPIELDGAVQHIIVLHTTHEERDWPETFMRRLRVLGELLAGSLERSALVEGLREAEERVSLAADAAGAGLWAFDYAAGSFWVNDRIRAIFGYAPDEAVTAPVFLGSVLPDDRPGVEQALWQRAETAIEYRILRRDGQVRRLASRGRPIRDADGGLTRLTGSTVDVTERWRTEEELSDLSRRLISAHEDERSRLARELHDDVSQRLAVLAIDAGRLEHAAGDAGLAAGLRQVGEGLARLSEDVHGLAYRLHPAVLEELGLSEALRASCERLGRRGEPTIRLDLDEVPADLSKDAALCLFRVAQEALGNVIRHAGARAASVSLQVRDDGLRLAIRDDGVGFDPSSPGPRKTLGLASMRERVRLLRGTLDVDAAPGRGTSITVWLPAEGALP